jgi:hypothetical protein
MGQQLGHFGGMMHGSLLQGSCAVHIPGAKIRPVVKQNLRYLKLVAVRRSVKRCCAPIPLHCAAWKGHTEVVKLLLSAGAAVNDHNQNGHCRPVTIPGGDQPGICRERLANCDNVPGFGGFKNLTFLLHRLFPRVFSEVPSAGQGG